MVATESRMPLGVHGVIYKLVKLVGVSITKGVFRNIEAVYCI